MGSYSFVQGGGYYRKEVSTLKGTSILIVQGRHATEQWMPSEVANGLLTGQLKIERKDVRITDVLVDTKLSEYAFYTDTTLLPNMLEELGFEPHNKKGR